MKFEKGKRLALRFPLTITVYSWGISLRIEIGTICLRSLLGTHVSPCRIHNMCYSVRTGTRRGAARPPRCRRALAAHTPRSRRVLAAPPPGRRSLSLVDLQYRVLTDWPPPRECSLAMTGESCCCSLDLDFFSICSPEISFDLLHIFVALKE